MDKIELFTILDELRKKLDKENLFQLELKSTKKRSLNANAYMWVLCEKIAKEIKNTREDVYKEAIKQVGVYDDLALPEKATERFVENWCEKGLGWFAESFGESKVKGADKVRVYYGSSIYSTGEMSRLVDYIVGEAQNLKIETMTPVEIERMKANWRNQ